MDPVPRKRVSLDLSEPLVLEIDALAAREDRSRAEMSRLLIREAVRARGGPRTDQDRDGRRQRRLPLVPHLKLVPPVLMLCLVVGCGRSEPPKERVVYVNVPVTVRVSVTVTPAVRAFEVPSLPSPPPVFRSAEIVATVPAVLRTERPFCVIEDFLVRPPNSIGAVWFDGEIRNLGATPAKVNILVKAYSINGVLLDSKSVPPDRSPIPPGESVHFNHFVTSSTGDEIRKVIPEVVPR